MKGVLRVVGGTFAAVAGLLILTVASFAANSYVFGPLAHLMNVRAAERQNERTYRSGIAYVFDVKFNVEVGGAPRSETRAIGCYPKREAELDFASGAMTWDLLKRQSPPVIDVPIRDGQVLTFSSNDLNCYDMVRSYQDRDPGFDAGAVFWTRLSPLEGGDRYECSIALHREARKVAELVVHPPEVVSAREAPVREIVSREDYGPADRALMKERDDQPRPKFKRQEDSFHWDFEAGCWESASDMISRLKRSPDGVYRTQGETLCSERAAQVCGFH